MASWRQKWLYKLPYVKQNFPGYAVTCGGLTL